MVDLLEREANLEILRTALREVQADSGRVVLVSGEAGIGKTSLVERFTAEPQTAARVLWGGCDPLFTPRPLGPLHDMATQTAGDWSQQLNTNTTHPALFSAFLAELQRPSTIAVFEDVHWADEATLDLLKFLGRRITRTSALLVLTYRDDELGPRHPLRSVLGGLATSTVTRRIAVEPLTEQAIRALVGDHALDVSALHRQTAGNPFFVTEVLASAGSGLPATIRDAVLARAARLSASGRAVLQAAAVIGPRIEPWALAEITGAEAQAVEECLHIGVLVAQAEGLAFRHELARQAILESIAPPHKLALHRMTLDALRAAPTTRSDLARLAHHAEAAGDGEAVLAFAPAAARQAEQARSHRAAVKLYHLALRFADELPFAERAQLLDEYSVECDTVNQRPEAIEARRQAAALWQAAGQPLQHGESLSRVAQLLQIVGQKEEAEAVNRAALDVLEPLAPNRALITAYNTQAWLCLGNTDNAQGIAVAEKAVALAQHFEAEAELPRLNEILGLCWLYLDYVRGCDYLERSLALALKLDHATRAANVYANLASIYVDFHEFARAETLLAEGRPYAGERDLDSVRAYMDGWHAILNLHRGDWTAAEAIATQAAGRPDPSPGRGPALLALGRLQTRRGDPEARPLLDEALSVLLKQGFRQREGMVRAARAEAAWLNGDREQTLVEARAAYDLALSHHHPWYVGELAFWRWRAGEAIVPPEWAAHPFTLQMAGEWRAAAQAWEQMGCPYEQARALADGDPEAQLMALEIFDRLGARPAAEALRRTLQSAGRSVPRGPRPATRGNPFGLTRRQMDIVRLLIEGLSNAEIAARLHLSPKTVDHHVSAVLAKMDVRSRAAAAALARQYSPFAPK